MVRVLISLLLIGLIMPSLLAGCNKTESAEKERNVTTRTAIPLIDTYEPPAKKTATFALG